MAEKMGFPPIVKSQCCQPTAWKIYLQKKVDYLRRDVNRLQAVIRGGGRLSNDLITQ